MRGSCRNASGEGRTDREWVRDGQWVNMTQRGPVSGLGCQSDNRTRALRRIAYAHLMDANGILASLFISSIGLVAFLYGKKQARLPQLVIGIVLMVYTYFISSVVWMFVIAAMLLALLWFVVRLGW